jgi:hypothetical protein
VHDNPEATANEVLFKEMRRLVALSADSPNGLNWPILNHRRDDKQYVSPITRRNPMTFDEWMKQVDAVVGNIAFGLSVHDLPDIAFRDLFDSGATAQDAAEEALANADFPFEDLDYL